jgi:hypothetical protein
MPGSTSAAAPATAADIASGPASVIKGGRRSGVTVKALKRTLKKAGLKTSGKKATLRARAKKARLMGGAEEGEEEMEGARRSRRSRKGGNFKLY